MSSPINTDLRFGAPPNVAPFYQVASPVSTDLRFNNPNVQPVFVENAAPGVFNIMGYGVTGSGLDESAAYQAAINAAVSAGAGIVYHPPNLNVGIASTLVCNSDNVQLIGGGWSSQLTALAGLGANPLYRVLAPGGAGVFRYGIAIRDIFFNGNNVAGVGGVELQSTYHADLYRMRIRFCPGVSLFLTGSSAARGAYTHLIHCTITDGGAGIGVQSQFAENNVLIGGIIAHFQSAGGVGVKWQDGVNQIFGTIFDNCDTGLWCFFGHANQVSKAQFTNGLTRFIYLNGAQKTNISGCYFDAFLGSGSQDMINVDNANNIIEGNTVNSGTGWTNFIREFGTSCLRNLYANNQTAGLPIKLATGSTGIVRSNPGYNPLMPLVSPATPVPTTAATGGTIAAGVYGVEITYVNAFGETLASANGPITTTGATSTITIPAPPSIGNAVGWYAYVTQVNGATFTRQQAAGSPTSLNNSLTLTAPPTSTGANPPGANSTAGFTQPAVPASGAVVTNTTGVDCTIFVTGGTVTVVAVGGIATGQIAGAFRVPAWQTITLTYSVAPTWQWFGE